MDKLIKTSTIMHDIWHYAPAPRPLSVILAFIFWGSQITWTWNHATVNLWLGTIVSIFAMLRYGYDFVKWLHKNYGDKIRRKKSGGKY